MKPWIQAMSIALIFILIINLVLFALNKISVLMLWFVIAIAALVAFKIVPKVNHK